jgi:hypothetical protein
MNSLLPLLVIVVAAVFLARPIANWVLSVIPTHRIASEGGRRFANAAISGFVWVTFFAVGYALFGMAYGLGNFLFVWALLTAIEYFMPTRR